MAGNLNKVMLIGRLGKDPEVRYTKDGTAVCTLRLATSEQWKDKNGEKQERTEWHSVSLWARQAEIAQQYLQKGRLLYVEGRLETRKWQDQNGQDRYSTEIKCNDFQMLDRGEGAPPGGGGGGGRDSSGGSASGGSDRGPGGGSGGSDRGGERPDRAPRGGGGGSQGGGSRPNAPPPDDDMGPPPDDDDIPF